MRYVIFCLVTAFAGAAPVANAQVFRCAGPGGKLTFSDKPCDTASVGGMIQRERTFEEKMSEREQAYEAEARKQNRRMVERERDWVEQRQRAAPPIAVPIVRHSGNDWARRKELQNLETSASSISNNGGRWDHAAEAERARVRNEEAQRRAAQAAQAQSQAERNRPRPTALTSCNGMNCKDDVGNNYTKTPADPNLMYGPNGTLCHRNGEWNGGGWNCK